MRKIIFAINVTTDGCCDHTVFNPDDEVLDYFTRLTREAGILLYGRKTYELMVPYWPDVAKNHSGPEDGDSKFAEAFAAVPAIVVVSKSLKHVDAPNTTLLQSNLREEVQKLKQHPGKNILTGGVALPTDLLELGLIDELHFVVHPILSGKGRRLFDEAILKEKLNLTLIKSHLFNSGCVALHYATSGRP
jgi:dihydrofolate reductase